jgi:hypothetical protein
LAQVRQRAQRDGEEVAGQGAGAEHAEGWANERDAAGLRDANHSAADAVLHQDDADQRRGGQDHRGTHCKFLHFDFVFLS